MGDEKIHFLSIFKGVIQTLAGVPQIIPAVTQTLTGVTQIL
jgi:hypothetical protein